MLPSFTLPALATDSSNESAEHKDSSAKDLAFLGLRADNISCSTVWELSGGGRRLCSKVTTFNTAYAGDRALHFVVQVYTAHVKA